MLRPRLLLLALCAVLLAGGLPAAAQTNPPRQKLFVPIAGTPADLNPFGYDVRTYSTDGILDYITRPRPRWGRAGDVIWSNVEATRGSYNWAAMADVERNVKRLTQLGIEPVVIVQTSPGWARRLPDRLCSPPKASAYPDFARFMAALAKRYPEVTYWEIWNEPDYAPAQVRDTDGTGCWADSSLPYQGGAAYGELLKQVYPAVKAANPRARILGGALAYLWPQSQVGQQFLEGILASGAGAAMDGLSFHAYGDWGAGDLLVNKTLLVRQALARYNLSDMPLFATEIGVLCYTAPNCPGSFTDKQANYAARIYAEALALDLQGAFWFTLVMPNTTAALNAQLVDAANGTLTPRPAYYAFRNSAILMLGAEYSGEPITAPPPSQPDAVQVLQFRKRQSSLDPTKGSTLYVLWVNKFDWVGAQSYPLYVRPGSRAVCASTIQDDISGPYLGYCHDSDGNGIIWRLVNTFPQYVEVIDP